MIIEENELVSLSEEKGRAFITIKAVGYSLKQFDEMTRKHARLRVTDFMALKKAVDNNTNEPIEIGSWIDSVQIEVSNDNMQALVTIYESQTYIQENMHEIQAKINQQLTENNIIFGQVPIDYAEIITGKPYIIATGVSPQAGENAQITYLKQAEKKPQINEDGKADYFDMNFIVEIKEGSWLGEKIHAQEGIEGKNVRGEVVAATKGEDIQFKYDMESAYEVEENGKTVLRSRINGVISEVNGVLSVQKHLVINGDVGLETGNLQFDGSIQVKGTVMPGYSIVASGDISIESKDGVNAAKLIKSTEGDVFIKGGIFGKEVTTVEAHHNIYIKHANGCTLEAKENVHIGFYALGSIISGSEIFLDERKGKIIGGKAIAINSITAAFVGNSLERKTELIVQGIDRKILTENAKVKAEEMLELQKKMTKLHDQIIRLGALKTTMSKQQIVVYEQTKQQYNTMESELKEIDTEIQRILKLLRNSVEYFINVTREANAGSIIQIINKSTTLSKMTKGKFKLENGELNV